MERKVTTPPGAAAANWSEWGRREEEEERSSSHASLPDERFLPAESFACMIVARRDEQGVERRRVRDEEGVKKMWRERCAERGVKREV